MAEKVAAGAPGFRSEHEALEAVIRALISMVRSEFKSSPRLESFVQKRASGAREVLKRKRTTTLVADEVRERVLSSKGVEMGEPRVVKVRTLDGRTVEVRSGAPEEEAFHVTHVSRFRMKCTCWDAVRTASVADRRLERILRERGLVARSSIPPFSRYVLCKHTLASLAKGLYEGVLDLDDVHLASTLRLALFAAYLKEEENPDAEVVDEMLQTIAREEV